MVRRSLLILLSLLLGLPALSGAESPKTLDIKPLETVRDRFYRNPLPVSDIGDPHILPAEGQYHLFATGGSIGYNVWSSPDLMDFSDKRKALQKLDWASGDYWAPEVYAHNDQYVMLYSARRKEDMSLRIGIAVADAPEGPCSDPLGAPLFDFGYAVIDASLFVDVDGTPYLLYVRDCSENIVGEHQESHIYGVALAEDLMSVQGEPVLLAQPDAPWETNTGDIRWNEGPIIVAHDGQYYLYYSAHHFEDKAYSVGVASADHPLGPYTKQANNPILRHVETDDAVIVSGPGHNSFFTAGDVLYTAYHTHTYPKAPSGNRQLNIDTAGFHADGTAFINGPTRGLQLRPLDVLGLVNHAPAATGEETGLLTDGDTGAAAASADYAWQGKTVQLTWDAPVRTDMLLLYAPAGSTATGTLTLNGDASTPIDFSVVDGGIGEPLILPIEATEIKTLTLAFDAEASLFEIQVIGS